MRNAERKFYTQNSHNWLPAVKFTETRRKLRLVPTNGNLYHYGGNNPVKYIDPDGEDIIVDGDSDNRSTILNLINSLSETQYKYTENNELEIDNTKINEKGSSIYSNAINNLINNGQTRIQIGNTYRNENDEQVPLPLATDGKPQAGYTYGSTEAKIMHINITGEGASVFPTGQWFASVATPAEVLMHELAGHAEPRIMGHRGNAVYIENSIRHELYIKSNGYVPLQRMPDHTHGTHGNN